MSGDTNITRNVHHVVGITMCRAAASLSQDSHGPQLPGCGCEAWAVGLIMLWGLASRWAEKERRGGGVWGGARSGVGRVAMWALS